MTESFRSVQIRKAALVFSLGLKATRGIRAKKKPPANDWRAMIAQVFSSYLQPPYADYHVQFWDHVASIQPGERVPPFISVWPRETGKSTSAEVAVAMVAALKTRRYCLYVCATQDQANAHVSNIASLLESPEFAKHYPATSKRLLSKYGYSRGWRANQLRTSDGFTVTAIGLDAAARGTKVEDVRPDFVICDDIDELHDTQLTTLKKIETLTKSILPTSGSQPAFVFAQNLILENGIAARLVDGRADFLMGRIVSGPHPAIQDFSYEVVNGRAIITGGRSTWKKKTLLMLQQKIDDIGISAFLAEFQHLVQNLSRGMFAKVQFQHIAGSTLPKFLDVQVWCDPAVSDTDLSDSNGVTVAGIDSRGRIIVLWTWEERAGPEATIRNAILRGRQFGASCVGIETDQGGDTWKSTYRLVWQDLKREGFVRPNEKALPMRSEKAGGHGSKAARASLMLTDYERANIFHVVGTPDQNRMTAMLERALRRFLIEKPYDLVDATFWAWFGLSNPPATSGGSVDYMVEEVSDTTPVLHRGRTDG